MKIDYAVTVGTRYASAAQDSPRSLRNPLGAGGMGEVYVARAPKINRDVAIKILPAAFTSDSERLRRFEQEVGFRKIKNGRKGEALPSN